MIELRVESLIVKKASRFGGNMSGMREYVCTVYLLHKYSFVQNSGSCLQTLITEDEADTHHLFFARTT